MRFSVFMSRWQASGLGTSMLGMRWVGGWVMCRSKEGGGGGWFLRFTAGYVLDGIDHLLFVLLKRRVRLSRQTDMSLQCLQRT